MSAAPCPDHPFVNNHPKANNKKDKAKVISYEIRSFISIRVEKSFKTGTPHPPIK
jgi:hypothetical protein